MLCPLGQAPEKFLAALELLEAAWESGGNFNVKIMSFWEHEARSVLRDQLLEPGAWRTLIFNFNMPICGVRNHYIAAGGMVWLQESRFGCRVFKILSHISLSYFCFVVLQSL